jgi:hypothetical protein
MYLLTDRDRAKNYIALMHDDINARKLKLESDWINLEYEFMGDLPSNEFYKIEDPSISEWQNNHLKSNWVSIQEDYFRSPEKSVISFNPDGLNYKYHSYNDLINGISRWFDTKKKLWQWGQQLNSLSKYEANFDLLDEDGLNYNEALFVLLGFDTNLLNSLQHPSFYNFTMLGFNRMQADNSYIENWLFDHSNEVQKLGREVQFQHKVIDTKKLIKWAKTKSLLIDLGKRVLSDGMGKLLYMELINNHLIDGDIEFKKLWQWLGQKNQKTYLARQLRIYGLLNEKCHIELEAYIEISGTKSQSDIQDPAARNKVVIDDVVKTLLEQHKTR